jgi:hypothetical protein
MIIEVVSSMPEQGTILLWGTDQEGLESLLHSIEALAAGVAHESLLSLGPMFEGVHLHARVDDRDSGVRQTAFHQYEWCLTQTEWDNVAGLIEPFLYDNTGFQVLSENAHWRVILAPTRYY